jgi:hypothetical protein
MFPRAPCITRCRVSKTPLNQKCFGWLFLIGIGMVVNPLRLLFLIGRDLIPSFSGETWTILTTPGTTVYHPLWAPLLIFELLGNIRRVAK